MKFERVVLASASALALAAGTGTVAHAAQPTAAVDDETTLGEIVVTARRRTESLQEVPQVVNAITSDTLQKLNIRDFRDIQTVVPGLNLAYNAAGFSSSSAMRGVTFVSTTAAEPSVAFYLNDVVVQSNFLFQAMFDVGQIEVLRGPQGTQRGASAPSGSITVTTRKPNLSEYGGYIDATATDLQARNINGAINIPVIRDVLGVRIAGLLEQNDADGVRSIYSKLRPRVETSAVRASVSFEPSDAFNANLSYTHLDTSKDSFVPISGPGFAGRASPVPIAATPPIGRKDRVSASDLPNVVHQHFDLATLQLDSRLWGHQLTYVGGYLHQSYLAREDRDYGNVLIGVPWISRIELSREETTHELRVASDPAPDRMFDYTLGVFYYWQRSKGINVTPTTGSFLPGTFGPPTALPNLALFDPAYTLPQIIPTPKSLQETSLFGSVTAHLSEKTELTVGARHIWTQIKSGLQVEIGAGQALAPVPVPCSVIGRQAGPYPGTCVIPIAGRGVVARPARSRVSDNHTIYNVSLKHRFTPDLMAYASVGTSFRPPYASIGTFSNFRNDPVLNSFLIHPSEKSRAVEVGVKWQFLEGRGRLNAAIFRQKFRDMPVLATNIPFINDNGIAAVVGTTNFTADPDAVVEGFDIDAAFQITPNWSISGQVAYSDGRVTGDGLPCNDSNFDGQPDAGRVTSVSQFPPGVLVALCAGQPVSQDPYWSTTLQSEYIYPVRDGVDAFVRGLFTYYPKNARRTPAEVIDNYSLLNLYTGIRANDGAWEVGLFARNALKTEKVTNITVSQVGADVNASLGTTPTSFGPLLGHPSGYVQKELTPRREVGINVRYAWGSR